MEKLTRKITQALSKNSRIDSHNDGKTNTPYRIGPRAIYSQENRVKYSHRRVDSKGTECKIAIVF